MVPTESVMVRFVTAAKASYDSKIKNWSNNFGKLLPRKLTGIGIITFWELKESGLKREDLIKIGGIGNKSALKLFKFLNDMDIEYQEKPKEA